MTVAVKGNLKDTFLVEENQAHRIFEEYWSLKMENKGTRVRILSKHGFSYSSLLSVEVIQDNLRVSWRTYPQKLGVEMLYLKEIRKSPTSDCNINLIFQGKPLDENLVDNTRFKLFTISNLHVRRTTVFDSSTMKSMLFSFAAQ